MRSALRTLWRSPAFALTAIGTIALAVSLAATVFAVVDGVLFKPLPYPRASELFEVMGMSTSGERRGSATLAALDVEYLRAADSQIGVTAYGSAPSVRHPNRPDIAIWSAAIDPNFFDILGQYPLVGGFSPEHYAVATEGNQLQTVLISYGMWRDRMGASPTAIGRTLDLIGTRVLVVGVLPHDFVFPTASGRFRPDILVPLVPSEEMRRNRFPRGFTAIVRVPAGMSRELAQARLDAALDAHVTEYPPAARLIPGPYNAVAMRPLEQLLGRVERPLFRIAFASAALLVVLGCVNVAGLLTARGRDRERELAVRSALGATRGQLARLLLLEAMLVALLGALVGLAVARPLLSTTLMLLPDTLLLVKPPQIDARVIVFAIGAATIIMLLISGLSLRTVLKPAVARGLSAMQTSTPRWRSWARAATLAAESAIGIALVVGGSLVVASLVALRTEDPGFEHDRLAILEVLTPGANRTEAPLEVQSRHAQVFARIEASPGVMGVATVGAPLLANMRAGGAFERPPGALEAFASDVPVSGAFFEVARLAVLDGRVPTRQEVDGGRPVIVVSESVARSYWPGQRVVGQTLVGNGKTEMHVVGVVEDARFAAQNEEAAFGEIYIPAAAATYPRNNWTVFLFRTSRDPATVAREVAVAVNRDVPGVIVHRAESFDAALANSVRVYGFRGILFGVAAVAGLLLLAVGVAGLVAMGVARRVRELGIRATLGARRAQLGRMIVADHLRPVLAGTGLGLIASWWTTKLLSGFLYGFEPHDPAIWATASALLLIVAALAAWIPARRASGVDPAVILRVELRSRA
jgi:predicted permease